MNGLTPCDKARRSQAANSIHNPADVCNILQKLCKILLNARQPPRTFKAPRKNNQPVTQHEYQFPASETLLSTTDTLAQLDDMTQQNAAMVEQSSAAASSMSDQSRRLLDAIKVFSV